MILKLEMFLTMIKKTIEVVAAVIEKDGKYFIARRPDKGELALKWEFPGGKIEPGESHEQALIREISEEFDAKIEVESYITTIHHEYNTFIIELHLYLCHLHNDHMNVLEHVNTEWVSKDQFSAIDFAIADIKALPWI